MRGAALAPATARGGLAPFPAVSCPLTHVAELPARTARTGPWPNWVSPSLLERLTELGIAAPWLHQITAAELARSGRDVVLSTGTASGKSLAYQLPALAALEENPRGRVLYLAPTKALAHDQLAAVAALAGPSVRPAAYDGDTPGDERDWVRQHSRWIVTNPDMLSRGILPRHPRWSSALRHLSFVVVDECHVYRGVFGAHVGNVLRRLRRICARYGAAPTFVLASATVADPEASALRLTGLDASAVTDDGSPRAASTFALWEPPWEHGNNGESTRRSATAETARILSDLVCDGARTVAFVRSRRGAEGVAAQARRLVADVDPVLAKRVAAYRGGYLPEERRELERQLDTGELLGVASTNALELGIDISGLDAVVLSGFPGTLASLWQQAGRAGRAGQESLAVFVAADDPLDHYLAHNPAAIFGRPVEASVFDPANPHVLGPQLRMAAAEYPLTESDLDLFGGQSARRSVVALVTAGDLRTRPGGWYWTHRHRPDVDLRSGGDSPVTIVETETGRMLGTVDGAASHSTVHSGALYVHQGASYVVDEFDLDNSVALVHAEEPEWTTRAQQITDLRIISTERSSTYGGVGVHRGLVDVTDQVVSYQRRRVWTGQVLAEFPLDLPPRLLQTAAVWITLDARTVVRSEVAEADLPGALHAAEHAAIGLLPLFATCDRWDIGGLSTALHPDTVAATIVVYDGHPGGAGFAERGHDAIRDWLTATRATIASCVCEFGCPSCIQSPKCGNGNSPLDKKAAVTILDTVLDALVDAGVARHPGDAQSSFVDEAATSRR
ncbi:MAG: DEAD/DEAH box helicase [Geodermatophilaceae bacterium]|nr:DEAD/DEAH box helicase [Geodermatophilaceae bacterium]